MAVRKGQTTRIPKFPRYATLHWYKYIKDAGTKSDLCFGLAPFTPGWGPECLGHFLARNMGQVIGCPKKERMNKGILHEKVKNWTKNMYYSCCSWNKAAMCDLVKAIPKTESQLHRPYYMKRDSLSFMRKSPIGVSFTPSNSSHVYRLSAKCQKYVFEIRVCICFPPLAS